MIFNCVSNVIDTLCSSVEFILGQAFNSDKDYFMKLQEAYETYYLGISFGFFTITLIMFPSFIKLYSSGITDINYVDPILPYLFVALNVLMYARRTSSQIINFAGHFKQTQWRSVLESVINLTVSLIMVYKFGIYGVLTGTIVALLYRTNDVIIYANWNILGRKPWKTYRRWGINLVVMCLLTVGINSVLGPISNYIQWFINAIWVGIVCMAGFIFVDSIFDPQSYQMIKGTVLGFLKKRKR